MERGLAYVSTDIVTFRDPGSKLPELPTCRGETEGDSPRGEIVPRGNEEVARRRPLPDHMRQSRASARWVRLAGFRKLILEERFLRTNAIAGIKKLKIKN